MEAIPLRTVKDKLSALVDQVQGTHERVMITRNGRAAAVLISPEDLAALEETLDVLSDPEAMTRLRQGRAELARGEGLTADQLRTQLAAAGH